MMILVRNLDKMVNEENLRSTFATFGLVNSVDICSEESYSGTRRFGFVDMNLNEALAAIKALHHIKLFNEVIRVTKANPKFGPDYYGKRKNPPVITHKTVMPAESNPPVVQTGKPEIKFGAARRPATDKRAYANSQFAQRNTSRPEYPRTERPYARNTSADGRRSYGHFKKREESRPSAPRGERSYGYQGAKERPAQQGTEFPPREPNGLGYVRKERSFDRNTSTGGSKPYGGFQKRDGARPSAPRGERSYGYQGSKERGSQQGTGSSHRDAGRPDYKPRGERAYDNRNSSAGSGRPFARFEKHNSTMPSAPRGERSFGYQGSKERGEQKGTGFSHRDSGRQEYKSRGERPYHKNSSAERKKPFGRF